MRNLVVAAAALAALAVGARAAPVPPPPDAPAPTAAKKEYDALLAEWHKAAQAKKPNPADWVPKFKAIVTKYPSDPAAVECLVWIVRNDRTPDTQQEALDALRAKHIDSPAIAGICASLEHWGPPGADAFLRAVFEKSKDHESQGRACYTLARMLKTRAGEAESAKVDPAFRANLVQWYGKELGNAIAKADPAALAKDAEALFERVVKDFSDLKDGKYTFADKANRDLFEMRDLAVGKAAPEIVGEDENGKAIKLSDFRGKVVMLDFWGFW
jgi:hypothetical protein